MSVQEIAMEQGNTAVRDGDLPREASAGALLDALGADWRELALAAAAAYQHRMTAARDIVLAVGPRTVRLRVEPTTTVAALAGEARAQLARNAGNAGDAGDSADAARTADADAPPVSARVLFADAAADGEAAADNEDGGPEHPACALAFAFAFDPRTARLRAGARAAGSGSSSDHTDPEAAEHACRLGHFTQRLLEAGPTAEIGRIDLLTPAEYRRIMHEWNDTAHEVPDLTLPELVQANAAAHPGRLAVSREGERLTYAELDARANRIARLLIASGAGAGDIVAMVLPRSVDYVVTCLAVTKTGAAYLPVDTSYPVERINQVLSDAKASHVVTVTGLTGSVLVAAEQLVLDDEATVARLDGSDPTSPTDADRRAPLTPDTPAYVLYTSGSTGRPKGWWSPTGRSPTGCTTCSTRSRSAPTTGCSRRRRPGSTSPSARSSGRCWRGPRSSSPTRTGTATRPTWPRRSRPRTSPSPTSSPRA